MKRLALIPARGGSKAIPNKNLKPLGGKPLIAWSAEAAKASGLFDKIVLSTDSKEIAAAGVAAGCEVPFLRPADISKDETPMLPVIQHALAELKKAGYVPDMIALLQPTSPFRKPETLKEAARLIENGHDSVVGVYKVPQEFSPAYLMKINEKGLLEFFFPEQALKLGRRQDAPPAYKRCGSVFAFSRACLETHGNIYGAKCHPLVAEGPEAVNIDSPEDWALAESFLAR